MKMYFRKHDSEFCYQLSEIKDMIRMDGKTEEEVFEAVPERNTGMFWCKHFAEIGYSSESCGRQCAEYDPRNGKSGRCRNHATPYMKGKSVLIKLKPKE